MTRCLHACLGAGALNQFNEEDMRKLGTVCSNVAENLKKVPWNSSFTSYSYDYSYDEEFYPAKLRRHRTQKSEYVLHETATSDLVVWKLQVMLNSMQTVCDDLKTYTVKVG